MPRRRLFHWSNASRRPTPNREGPASPSSLLLQKAQVRYISRKSQAVSRKLLGLTCGLRLEPVHAQSTDIHVCFTFRHQIRDDLAGEGGQQDAVPSVPGGVPQSLHVRVRSDDGDRKSTRLNSSHSQISYAVFCLKKKKNPIDSAKDSYCAPVTS